jgi:hypothetical protein
MICPKQQQDRRLWVLLLLPLLFLLPPSITAESFFPEGGESFFGKRREQPRIKLPSLPGFDTAVEQEEKEGEVSGEEEAPKKRYKWLITAGVMGDTGFDTGLLGINTAFLVLPHLGIGLGVWIHPNSWSMPGPADGGWVESDPYIDIVDNMDVNEQHTLYSILQTGIPMTGLTLHLDWYPGERGLSGFYTSMEGGVLVSWGWDFYPHWDASKPIIHIGEGDEVPLPRPTDPVGILLTPHVGYKLHIGWFLLDAKVGYAFGNWDVVNGYLISLNIGFSPGVRK